MARAASAAVYPDMSIPSPFGRRFDRSSPIPGLPAVGAAGGTPPSPSEEGARLRAEEPDDLLAVLPYLLGYHPRESLVMAVTVDRTIEVCIRVDLDSDPFETAERFGRIAAQHGSGGVLLVAYSDSADRADRLLEPVLHELEPIVIDALHADGRRWWSLMCGNPDCCPPEGVPYEIDTSRLAAEAVFAGMTAYSDRSEIARLVQGPGAEDLDALDDLAARIHAEVIRQPALDRQRWLRRFLEHHVEHRVERREHHVEQYGRAAVDDRPAELSREELVRLACLVTDTGARQEALTLITGEHALIHLRLWGQVVAVAVPSLAPAPLCLLGTAAWAAGQGTLQVCCLDRVRALDPGFGLTALLANANQWALPPGAWEGLRRSFADDLVDQPERQTSGPGVADWSMPWDC